MPKPADIHPRWLVSLLCQWARRSLAVQDGGLGYPKKSAFLIIHAATSARSDPTGESAQDFRELEEALQDCQATRPEQFMTLMMYYKPWIVEAMRAEGWPFANSTYRYRLHAAHKSVSEYILGCEQKIA